MTQATIHEAKTHLSKLISNALDGEEVIIANRAKPLVRLQPLKNARRKGRIGGLKHWRKTGAAILMIPGSIRKFSESFIGAKAEDTPNAK